VGNIARSARRLTWRQSSSAVDCLTQVRNSLRSEARQAPGAAHGVEADDQGNGTVTEQRLYQLIQQPGTIVDRQFEIEFLDPRVEPLAFTFG
jgi:hypothetical protein